MTEFENLKRSYTATVQFGLLTQIGYQKAKQGNDLLHKFCENYVDNGNYTDVEKSRMKCELETLKEALSHEIETYYFRKG